MEKHNFNVQLLKKKRQKLLPFNWLSRDGEKKLLRVTNSTN